MKGNRLRQLNGKKLGLSAIRIALCVALIFSSSVGMLDVSATAQASGSDGYFSLAVDTAVNTTENTYMLVCETGALSGERVEAFIIRYKSSASNAAAVSSEIVQVQPSYTYTVKQAQTWGKALFTDKTTLNTYLGTRTVSPDAISKKIDAGLTGTAKTPLSSYSTDYFMFTTDYAISSVVDIQIICNYGDTTEGKNEWSCQSLKLVKANVLNGAARAGTITNDIFPLFSGKVICSKKTSSAITWTEHATTVSLGFSSGSTFYGNDKQLVTGNGETYSNVQSQCYLEMDISELSGSGLEELEVPCNDPAEVEAKLLHEELLVTVEYTSVSGGTNKVRIPFVSVYAAELYYANTLKSVYPTGTKIDGYFRAGDTVGILTTLPGVKKVTSVKVEYTTDATKYTDTFSKSYFEAYNYECDSDNNFAYSAIRAYTGDNLAIGFYCDGSGTVKQRLKTDTAAPDSHFVASTASGNKVEKESDGSTAKLADYQDGDVIKVSAPKNLYLVSITTDDMASAGTNDEISFALKYKRTSTGIETTTAAYTLSEVCKTYYGYWPSTSDEYETVTGKRKLKTGRSFTFTSSVHRVAKGYFPYYLNTNPSKTVCFFVELSDVAQFTGAEVSIDGTDTWQIKELKIQKVSSYGTREITWQTTDRVTIASKVVCDEAAEIKDGGDIRSSDNDAKITARDATTFAEKQVACYSDRIITRTFDAPVTCVTYSKQVLVDYGVKKVISFEDGGESEKEAEYDEYDNYMSYEETKQDFGFAKTRYTYKVEVQVGKASDENEANEDCGSTNQFYFQLVFTNGKSAYVLANQQLSADGFRTGKKESFLINVNRDYGDLTAVHIIPENPSDDEDVFDKLKIEEITVSKLNESSINVTWHIAINKWISIDYSDAGAKDGVIGQQGRSEADIARTFTVTSSGYEMNFVVALTTGSYNSDEKFTGNLSMTVFYEDTEGNEQETEVNLTEALYQYAGKTYRKTDTINGKEYTVMLNSMLRANLTDRFYVSLPQVKKIHSVSFTGINATPITLHINRVAFYTIESEGVVVWNAADEYENTGEVEFLCANDAADKTELVISDAGATATSGKLNMSDHTITIDIDDSGIKSKVDYLPQNQDDTMNMYVYMSEDADSVANYDMTGAIVYSNVNDSKIMQKSVSLIADTQKNLFYKTGIAASGLNCPTKVLLRADGSFMTKARVNYVVVEHVRSGVIVDTSYFYFNGTNAVSGTCEAKASGEKRPSGSQNKQYISFMLTDDSSTTELENKVSDLAFSITYTSNDGTTTHTLTSPNYFLSEQVDENGEAITSIYPKKVYTVAISQENVNKITSINFIGVGSVAGNAGIKSAYIANYSVNSSGVEQLKNWYSFATGITTLSSTIRSMNLTDGTGNTETDETVADVCLKIKTAEATETADSGVNGAVAMIIGYTMKNGSMRYVTYTDIRQYAVSGTTKANDTIELRMLLNNVSAIRSVELRPESSATQNDQWLVESIELQYTVSGEEASTSRIVNGVASPSVPLTVNMSNVTLSVHTYSHNDKTNASYNHTFVSTKTENEGVMIGEDQTITFTPSIDGSTNGVSCKCYKVQDGINYQTDGIITVSGTSTDVRSVEFSAADATTPAGTYKVVFASNEFANVSVEITVVVESSEKETSPTTDPEEPSESEEEPASSSEEPASSSEQPAESSLTE